MSRDTLFTVHIDDAGQTMRGTVVGELDLLTEPDLVIAFNTALHRSPATAAVLDLRQVGFIDSSGLRALLLCRDQAQEKGVGFFLAVAEGPVMRLLEVAGVKGSFTYA